MTEKFDESSAAKEEASLSCGCFWCTEVFFQLASILKLLAFARSLIFFGTHDPIKLNRQGTDVGMQYRSAIFYCSEEQKATVKQLIAELTEEKNHEKPIATTIEPFEAFCPAESYHKDYFKKHPKEPYCQAVTAPKNSQTTENTFI